jgi:hypothetical protein
MPGKIHEMINAIIEKRAQGNVVLRKTTETKLDVI